jgi:PAS domain S-box-containing protein
MKSLPSRIILLLVDDSATCEAIRPFLQADQFARYSIIEKETGATGLEALRSVKMHAVLLASRLPDMKAQQWLLELEAATDLHKPPVIALLDEVDPDLEEELLQAGARFCLRSAELSPSVLQQTLRCAIELAERERTVIAQKLELLERRREWAKEFAERNHYVKTELLTGQALPAGQPSTDPLRLAFEAAKMGYWEWRIQPNEMVLGNQTEKVFGLQPGEFKQTYEGFLELVHPDDQAWVAEDIKRALEGATNYQAEFRTTRPDGQTRWIAARGHTFFNEAGQAVLMSGMMRDVTERVKAEAALRASEQLNQTVLDSLPQHIAVLDRTGRIVAVNRAWATFAIENSHASPVLCTGVGANYLEVCEKAVAEGALEIQAVCDGIKAVLHGTEQNYQIEYSCHSPTEQCWFLMQITPLSRERGGAVVSHLDITDRIKSERERAELLGESQAARAAAEAANRAKDEFIAQITHDLRSPLNAILGWTKVLLNKKVDETTRAEALQTIVESAEKQKHLIEDLLDISRIVSGKLRLEVQPISLQAVIHSAMEVMKPACEAKEIDCSFETETEADDITGDPVRLEQVIWNLISNAVKFTPNRGQVKVRLERADPHMRITIIDTGRGVRKEHLPYLFKRYWQPDEAGTRQSGLGLGLSLVKHIVELHGGTVDAESEGEGRGAKFIINLPMRAVRSQNTDELNKPAKAHQPAAPDATPAWQAALSSTALQGLLVLVTDDEQNARELVAEILRQHGAELMIAASASEALALIAGAKRLPDLLVSDISMPEEDGYSLIRKLRRLSGEEGGQIPAIALTAFGRMEDRVRALSAGFQMHLPKPVEPAELALVAANLTGREINDLML